MRLPKPFVLAIMIASLPPAARSVTEVLDEPTPIPPGTTILPNTGVPAGAALHAEHGKFWATWPSGRGAVMWSLRDASRETWSAPRAEPCPPGHEAAAEAAIRARVLES